MKGLRLIEIIEHRTFSETNGNMNSDNLTFAQYDVNKLAAKIFVNNFFFHYFLFEIVLPTNSKEKNMNSIQKVH